MRRIARTLNTPSQTFVLFIHTKGSYKSRLIQFVFVYNLNAYSDLPNNRAANLIIFRGKKGPTEAY